MGTYGVTHIKKNDKIIPFSDSYDGYWSGMGLSNLIGLKHIPLSILAQLFDSFTARTAFSSTEIAVFHEPDYTENIETALSYRQFNHFLLQVAEDSCHNPEAIAWANEVVKNDIRTSSIGIVPLLYLNTHPHYGYNYSECDYLIDLDKEIFVFKDIGLEVPISLIQSTPIENIKYFFEDDLQLIDFTKYFDTQKTDLASILNHIEFKEAQAVALIKIKQILEEVFSLPLAAVQDYFKEKEIITCLNIDKNNQGSIHNNYLDENLTETNNAYSFYSTNLTADQLRKTLFFLQFKSQQPGYEFIFDCAEWGLEETYAHGGLNMKTPNNKIEQRQFEEIITVLEKDFKLNFNISSGAAIGFAEDFEHQPTIKQSIFNFEDLKKILAPEDYDIVMSEGLPYLAYHTRLEEAINHIISQDGQTNSPVFWIFVALLSQNKELFDIVYPHSKTQCQNLEQEDINRVQNLYLSSYYDGQQLSFILNRNTDFVDYIKTTSFFSDCENVLTDSEKTQLLHQ